MPLLCPWARACAPAPGSSGQWYDKPGYGKLVSPYQWHRPLPALIDAWRSGKVDWHDLIPAHSSLWER